MEKIVEEMAWIHNVSSAGIWSLTGAALAASL
jgi:hypothetical protein